MTQKANLFGLTVGELTEAVEPLGARPYAARQIASHLYARRERRLEAMTDLPADLRRRLDEAFEILLPAVAGSLVSDDGTTRYVLDLPAGGRIEAVFIPAGTRATLCISSQAGCAFGCGFCMTATMGLQRHLSSGEIAGQVALLMERHGLEPNRFNIVFMGMGEPLHNLDGLLASLELLCDGRSGFGLSPRHVTVSTVGVVPGIERLAEAPIVPRLAVSLNATTDETRSRLMPVNRTWPIARLMEACRFFLSRRRGRMERLTLEYVLLEGVNDHPSDLSRLAALAAPLPARVNLIPFNSTPELPFRGSPRETILAFRDGLLERGVRASVRSSRGRDVRAACGQLALAPAEAPGAGHEAVPAGGLRPR